MNSTFHNIFLANLLNTSDRQRSVTLTDFLSLQYLRILFRPEVILRLMPPTQHDHRSFDKIANVECYETDDQTYWVGYIVCSLDSELCFGLA
jgi:hypothetical protein